MKIDIEGAYLIEDICVQDSRGSFTKVFNETIFQNYGLCTYYKEFYYSVSNKDVIRGMHFQLPPSDHEKLVYVPEGEITDVLLDLRRFSTTYGLFFESVLSADNHRSIYIPRGIAHGFKSNRDQTIVVYQVSTVYDAGVDAGIRYDSFGYDWQVEVPVISERDLRFPGFEQYKIDNRFS